MFLSFFKIRSNIRVPPVLPPAENDCSKDSDAPQVSPEIVPVQVQPIHGQPADVHKSLSDPSSLKVNQVSLGFNNQHGEAFSALVSNACAEDGNTWCEGKAVNHSVVIIHQEDPGYLVEQRVEVEYITREIDSTPEVFSPEDVSLPSTTATMDMSFYLEDDDDDSSEPTPEDTDNILSPVIPAPMSEEERKNALLALMKEKFFKMAIEDGAEVAKAALTEAGKTNTIEDGCRILGVKIPSELLPDSRVLFHKAPKVTGPFMTCARPRYAYIDLTQPQGLRKATPVGLRTPMRYVYTAVHDKLKVKETRKNVSAPVQVHIKNGRPVLGCVTNGQQVQMTHRQSGSPSVAKRLLRSARSQSRLRF